MEEGGSQQHGRDQVPWQPIFHDSRHWMVTRLFPFFCEEAAISLDKRIVIPANNHYLIDLPILQKDLFLNALRVVLFLFQLLAFVF